MSGVEPGRQTPAIGYRWTIGRSTVAAVVGRDNRGRSPLDHRRRPAARSRAASTRATIRRRWFLVSVGHRAITTARSAGSAPLLFPPSPSNPRFPEGNAKGSNPVLPIGRVCETGLILGEFATTRVVPASSVFGEIPCQTPRERAALQHARSVRCNLRCTTQGVSGGAFDHSAREGFVHGQSAARP